MDLAVLGIEVRSTEVERANRELDKMPGAAKRAEAAAKGLGTNASNAAKQVAAANDNMAASYSRVGAAIGRLASMVAGVATLALLAFVGTAMATGKELLEIERNARLAGLSLRDLQTLQLAGAQVGVSSADVNKGAVGLAKSLNEARREENELTKFLDLNNVKWKDRQGAVIGVNEALVIAADLMSRAGTELDKLDIAKKFNIPENMIPLLENGAGQFLTMRNNAAAAGQVIDDDIIKKAKEFDEAWTSVVANFTANFKARLVDMASAFSTWISGVLEKTQRWGAAMRVAANPNAAAGAAGARVGAALGAGANYMEQNPFGTLPKSFNTTKDFDLQRRLIKIHELETKLNTKDKEKSTRGGGGGMGGLSEEEQRYNQVVSYIANLERAGRVLEAEVATIGKSNAERQKAIELARIGVVGDKDQLAIIDQQVAKNEALRKKLEDVKKARDGVFDAANFAGGQLIDVFESMVDGSKSLEQSLQGVVKALIKAALQAAILGQGPLAGIMGMGGSGGAPGGLIGGLLSGFGGGGGGAPNIGGLFASGGYTGNGPRSAAAGVVHGQEYVFSAAATKRIGVGNLEAMHRSAKGYASGGYVGPMPTVSNDNRSAAAPVTVNVINNAGAEVKTRETTGADGSRQLEIMVDQMVANSMSQGSGRKVLERQYGMSGVRGR